MPIMTLIFMKIPKAMNKQNRIWIALVVILVIINLVSLVFLWQGRAFSLQGADHRPEDVKADRTENLLKRNLRLDQNQIQQFRDARKEHFRKIRPIESELKARKKELFEMNTRGLSAANSEETMKEIASLHLKIDSLTYEHFSELRSYCREDQMDEFNQFLKRMLGREFGERRQGRKGRL